MKPHSFIQYFATICKAHSFITLYASEVSCNIKTVDIVFTMCHRWVDENSSCFYRSNFYYTVYQWFPNCEPRLPGEPQTITLFHNFIADADILQSIGSPLSRRPRKFRLSRALAEKNIRLSRRENSGLNANKSITKVFSILKLIVNRNGLLYHPSSALLCFLCVYV